MKPIRLCRRTQLASLLMALCSGLTAIIVTGCAPQPTWLGVKSGTLPGNSGTQTAPATTTNNAENPVGNAKTPTAHAVKTTPEGAQWTASPLKYEQTSVITPNPHLSVPVLMYHDIIYLPNNSLGMSPSQFAEQMAWLHAHGFHPINLGQLYAAMYKKGTLPSRPIVITFDDGYESVYSNAYPVLKKYRFPATVFMITGAVGHRGKFPMLTWPQLSTMETSGVIDVESHTVHHIDMSLASQTAQQAELINSAKTITSHLHHPVLYFCYPSSKYNATTMTDLQTDGYLLAFTEHPGYANVSQGAYQLHRLRVWEGMPIADFAGMLSPSLH